MLSSEATAVDVLASLLSGSSSTRAFAFSTPTRGGADREEKPAAAPPPSKMVARNVGPVFATRKTRGQCSSSGCSTLVYARGLCVKHGGKRTTACTFSGCTTNAQARGLCTKHGAKGESSQSGTRMAYPRVPRWKMLCKRERSASEHFFLKGTSGKLTKVNAPLSHIPANPTFCEPGQCSQPNCKYNADTRK